MLLFLPLVGAEIGALWALAALLFGAFFPPGKGASGIVAAFFLTAIPLVLTGGIHLDGFMDVTDAVRSWRDVEERRRILKDPHAGSFAVIGCVMCLLAAFASFASGWTEPVLLIGIPVVSRCMSVIAVSMLPKMGQSEYSEMKRDARSVAVPVVIMLFAAAVSAFFSGVRASALLAVVAGYGVALFRGYKSLGGMNGDIAGYALTVGETWGLIAMAVIGL